MPKGTTNTANINVKKIIRKLDYEREQHLLNILRRKYEGTDGKQTISKFNGIKHDYNCLKKLLLHHTFLSSIFQSSDFKSMDMLINNIDRLPQYTIKYISKRFDWMGNTIADNEENIQNSIKLIATILFDISGKIHERKDEVNLDFSVLDMLLSSYMGITYESIKEKCLWIQLTYNNHINLNRKLRKSMSEIINCISKIVQAEGETKVYIIKFVADIAYSLAKKLDLIEI
jgi:hypothetical protein